MRILLHEPRPDRLKALRKELATARIAPITVGADFFVSGLSELEDHSAGGPPVVIAATEQSLGQVRRLRAAKCENPIVLLRDVRQAAATAAALDAGADDDVLIPVKGPELRARIHSIRRRAFGHAAESVTIGEVRAFFDGRDPEVSNQRLKLSGREHAIFQQLVLNANRVVPKSAIYDSLYGLSDGQPMDNVIDVYVCKLRKKIGAAAESGAHYIETVRGRGYTFAAPAPVEDTALSA